MKRWWLLACLCGCTVSNTLLNGVPGDGGGGAPDGSTVRDGALGMDLPAVFIIDLATSQPDLTKLPDLMSSADFKGISCGTMSCGGGQICCAQPTTGFACQAAGTCPDAGLASACDGLEDCEPSKPSCCVALAGANMTGSGNAECRAMCDGSLMINAGGGFDVRTRLCHGDADCTGFTGTYNGNSSAWSSCCHNANGGAGAPHFCANALIAGFGGFTCP